MEAIFVDNLTDLARARDEILTAQAYGVDTETTGFDPHDDEVRLLQIATRPDKAFVFNLRELNDPADFEWFTDILGSTRVKCFQNAKFDLKFLRAFFNQGMLPVESVFDTLLASKLIAMGDGSINHDLGTIARRELGVELDKSLQKSDFGSTDLSPAQLMYAARDASILLEIRDSQIQKIRQHSLEKVTRIECDAVTAIADLEFDGIYLDGEEWAERVGGYTTRMEELKAEIYEAILPVTPVIDLFGEPVINIDSGPQITPVLRALGIPIQDSIKEGDLELLKGVHPLMDTYIEYRGYSTALDKFGPEYLKFIHPKTGRIHANFHQLTAPSGRMSASKPNLQQVPAEKIYRRCFKAQRGGKIITADYGQIELRIMAMQSRDPELVKAYHEDKDLHSHTRLLVFGIPYEDTETTYRRYSKNLNFGTAYGVGAERFSVLAGMELSAAEQALGGFWSVYHVLDKYLKNQGWRAAEHGIAKTWSGRTVKLPVVSRDEDRKQYGRNMRLGRNFGVQGTGADILKRAAYLFRNAVIANGIDARLINLVHDEKVVEASDADAEIAAETLKACMIEAGEEVLGDIPCKVDVKIGDTWLK